MALPKLFLFSCTRPVATSKVGVTCFTLTHPNQGPWLCRPTRQTSGLSFSCAPESIMLRLLSKEPGMLACTGSSPKLTHQLFKIRHCVFGLKIKPDATFHCRTAQLTQDLPVAISYRARNEVPSQISRH